MVVVGDMMIDVGVVVGAGVAVQMTGEAGAGAVMEEAAAEVVCSFLVMPSVVLLIFVLPRSGIGRLTFGSACEHL